MGKTKGRETAFAVSGRINQSVVSVVEPPVQVDLKVAIVKIIFFF
ncbi:MAG: hypothetical protein Q7J72_03880 [Candidatus Omnitrophota bacterium]|nr:hypothetical protein [Candidatus Omnitrophota bacterium]